MPEQDEPIDPIFEADAFDLAERILSNASDEPIRPEDFGPYRFFDDQPLGSGAMSDVWRARESGIDRDVAVKFLHRTSEPGMWAGREMKRLGALEFQYIARLYNHGVLEDGTPWLAMEYVDGEALDEYCKQRKPGFQERFALFHRVCEGVQYAHGRFMVHGDLKPSNIRVRKDGEPKLLDFGLAEHFQNPDGGITQSPSALGFTPAYAAPEQFRGEPVSVAIDVYALGVILYGLLAGKLPFDEPDRTLVEIEASKMSARTPDPPSKNAARDGRIGASDWRELDALTMKAMDADPSRRFQNVSALLQDLDRFEKCEPLEARTPHPWMYRLGKFLKRNRGQVIAVSAAVLFVIGVVSYYTLQLAKARDAALAESARTQKVKEFFLSAFNHAAEDALPSEKTRIVNLFLDRGTRDARSLGQDVPMQADIYQGFGTMYQEWGALDQAERLLREAVSMGEANFSKSDSRVVKGKLALGHLLEERGAYHEAIAIGDEILRIPPLKSDYPLTLSLLSEAHFHLGHYPLADSLNQQALAADKLLYGPNHPSIADDLMNLGNLEVARGKYPQAENYYRQAMAINESNFGKNSPQAADSASYVAQAMYFPGGREAEAAQLLKDALDQLERARGKMDSRVAFTVAQMGALAIEMRNFDEAEADYIQAVDIYRTIRGDAHKTVAIELANLASVWLKKKQYVQAERGFRDVIQRFERILPADNVDTGIARIKLGHTLLLEKRYQDSEAELLKGYEIVAKQTSPSVDWLVHARKDLVDIYAATKQPEKAARFQAEMAVQK